MKYKVSVIKKIAFLVMTMALAVAMVACSAAAGKPGPAGPPGEQGPSGEPATAEPGDPTTTPGGPVPVQMIEGIDPIIFDDSTTGDMDTGSQTVMIADHFYPSTGLMYSLDGDPPEKVSAEVMDGVLTVGLKSGAPYDNFMLTVKASNEISSATITFAVRRNQPPVVSMYTSPDDKAAIPVWVGTQKPKELKIVDLAPVGTTCVTDCVSVSTKGVPDLGDLGDTQTFFYDDIGNTLKLVPEKLNTSKAAMLEVTGGSSKVILKGIKSTRPTGADESPIQVDFVAEDDNGLTSQDTHVLTVSIDAAPTTVGAIGTRVIKASSGGRMITVTALAEYFDDDRQSTTLDYYAWSDNPEVALVEKNPGNVMKVDATASKVATDLVINAVNLGEAMITVRAVEQTGENDTPGDFEQWVDQTFKVVVQLD